MGQRAQTGSCLRPGMALNRAGFAGGCLVKVMPPCALIGLGTVTQFRFCGWDISDRFEQATIVELVDPYESGEFHRLGSAPRATPVDHLGFEQAVSASALSKLSPTLPTDGSMPASRRRSL